MGTDTFPDGDLKSVLEKFVLVSVNVDKRPQDIKKLIELTKVDVTGIPDIRVLTKDGKQVDQQVGFRPPAEFKVFLEKALEKIKAD